MSNSILTWLADTPLFIDGDQVRAFYDAVVRPEYEEKGIELTFSEESKNAIQANVGAEAKVGLADWIKSLIPGMNAEITAKGGVGGTVEGTDGSSDKITLSAIQNPHRQLIQLALHYAANHNQYLWVRRKNEMVESIGKYDATGLDPKPLVFLDLPGIIQLPTGEERTHIIPLAAEFADGTVKLMFEDLMIKMVGIAPSYLSCEKGKKIEEYQQQQRAYWKRFSDTYDVTKCMVSVEEASGSSGRIRWIDYSLILDNEGNTLHLHCSPKEKENTGIFAHRIIYRGYHFGLRIVGSLCSGPSLNVLAIFDK
ncbi:MAG: hypothetical protein ABFD69_04130 [Candidatus Sumerlaeia bacterium]